MTDASAAALCKPDEAGRWNDGVMLRTQRQHFCFTIEAEGSKTRAV